MASAVQPGSPRAAPPPVPSTTTHLHGAGQRASIRAPPAATAPRSGGTPLVPPGGPDETVATAAALLTGPRQLPPPSPAVRVQSTEAAHHAALAASAGLTTAVAAAVSVGRVAASTTRAAATASRRVTHGVGALEADLHSGVDAWTGDDASPVQGSTGAPAAYLPAVPMQLLRNDTTDRATLSALCAERTIPAGADESLQSLKTSLLRFNASSSTVKGARMLATMAFVRGEAQVGRGALADYQAAVAHPVGVGVDGAPALLAADARRRQAAPIALLGDAAALNKTAAPPQLAPPTLCSPTSQRGADTSPSPAPPIATGNREARHATAPARDTPSLPIAATASDGATTLHPSAPHRRSSSLLHASRLVHAMLEEEAERNDAMATAAGLADVKSLLHKVFDRVTSHANSQAAANLRTDTALGTVLQTQSVLVAASGSASVRRPVSRGAGSEHAARHTKKAKVAAAGRETSPELTSGGAVATAVAAANATDAAQAGETYTYPLVHDWGMPIEMMTGKFDTEPLFLQLANLVKLCHVSVGHPGIFGSYACAQLYEQGLVRSVEVVSNGGAAAAVNATKTERVRAIIKNKAKKYIVVLGWLHGLCPGVFKRPAESTYENMRSHTFALNDAVLLEAVKRDADDLGWSADHSIRVPSAARLNQLHNLVQSKGKRGGGGRHTTPAGVLDSSPFKELLAAARKNVEAKYGCVVE